MPRSFNPGASKFESLMGNFVIGNPDGVEKPINR